MAQIELYSEFFELYDTRIHEFIRSELDKSFALISVASEDVNLRQLQGRIQVYNELLDLIENADAKIALIKNESKDLSGCF